MPIRYAGPGHWSVFERPRAYSAIAQQTIAVPSTKPSDHCLVIPFDLWATFEMSRQRVTARNVVATVFPHAMNWEAKPQLHSHCVVMMD